MAHLDINNQMVMYQNERNAAEQEGRFRWIEKNKDLLLKAATLTREPNNYFDTDIMAYEMKAGMPAVTRDNVARGYNNIKVANYVAMPTLKDVRTNYTIANLGIGDPNEDPRLLNAGLAPDPIMRPVDPKTTAILYQNLPKMASETYLKERAKLLPEDRYYFPECTSMDYGWRLKDAGYLGGPLFPLVCEMEREKTRVGPQPDPAYYDTGNIKVCP